EAIQNQFDNLISFDLDKINFLKPSKLELKNLDELQKKFKFLKEQIGYDNWILFNYKGDNLNEFILLIQDIINTKIKYFNSENDYFITEFKWFQYFNSLTENQKELISQLKVKKDWEKVFLINYLNSLLVDYATMNLPTDDDEHKELDTTLNGIEKEQLKFIK